MLLTKILLVEVRDLLRRHMSKKLVDDVLAQRWDGCYFCVRGRAEVRVKIGFSVERVWFWFCAIEVGLFGFFSALELALSQGQRLV